MKVSIVIATYGRPQVLRDRALRSVQAQTFQDWECIVVDGTPTDETKQVVESLAAEDPRFRYFKKLDGRQSAARNAGIRYSHGELIAIIDDDDDCIPAFLNEMITALASMPDISYISSHAINRDDHGVETYSAYSVDPYWKYGIGNMFVFRRGVFLDKHLYFDESLLFGDDVDLHIQFHNAGEKGYIIPKALRIYHLGLDPEKRPGRKLGGATVQGETFDAFFKKDEIYYREAGREAMSWLYLFGGLIFARVGNMGRSRWFLVRSLRFHPTGVALAALVAGWFGHGAFVRYEREKGKFMRWFRANIINRV